MTFEDLHEFLRLELLRRIDRGLLTGVTIARQAGFRQAHISNFLNRKRALSLSGLDRVLASQNLTVSQIMPVELSASSDGALAEGAMEAVPLVSSSTAMEDAVVRAGSMIEAIHVAASQLGNCRSRPSPKFAGWQRFVAVRADAQQAAAMEPMIQPGATLVIDRHYNSLAPYRAHHRTLYAVRSGLGLALRFLDFDEGRLILRPLSPEFPVQLLAPTAHEAPADYIVGRVCLLISEL
ncbi:MAG TPA: S24 family peptidase [Acidobacteriaceae bacterium]|nr:S24 family peptidase [Acidobacteriaceae bacterium]